MSFETLRQKYGLGQDHFYRYLQVRHYFDENIKIIIENSELGFVGFVGFVEHCCYQKIKN